MKIQIVQKNWFSTVTTVWKKKKTKKTANTEIHELQQLQHQRKGKWDGAKDGRIRWLKGEERVGGEGEAEWEKKGRTKYSWAQRIQE